MNTILKILVKSRQPVTFKQLLVQSGLDAKSLKKQLRDLVRQGKVQKYRNATYVASKASSAPAFITGKLDLHPDGYGFMAPDDGGKDIFIPRNKMMGAMHGDKVKISPESFRGKTEGRIVDIVERSAQKIVGRV